MLIPTPYPKSLQKYNEKEEKKLHFRMKNNFSELSKLKKTQ